MSPKGRAEVLQTAGVISRELGKRKGAASGVLIFSSPMERTMETAKIICKELGLKSPTRLKGLLECDFGSWTGRSLSSLRKLKAWERVQKTPSGFAFPKGESFLEMQGRIVKTLDRLAESHPGKTLIAASHADPIKAALCHYLGMPLDLFQRIHVSPASISILTLSDGTPLISAVNIKGGAEQ